MKPERESQECPGCGGVVMCVVACRVRRYFVGVSHPKPGKQEPNHRGTSAPRLVQRGPLRLVVERLPNGLFRLECEHLESPRQATRDAKRFRCGQCETGAKPRGITQGVDLAAEAQKRMADREALVERIRRLIREGYSNQIIGEREGTANLPFVRRLRAEMGVPTPRRGGSELAWGLPA